MDRFEEFLKEVGEQLGTPLHPDHNRACNLNINQVLHIQMEEEPRGDTLLIASFLAEIPPGKFRENVLKEALKSNALHPRIGTLGYSERNNKLACFERLSWHGLNAQKFIELFEKFLEKADSWRVAIESGQASPEPSSPTSNAPSIFDIKK